MCGPGLDLSGLGYGKVNRFCVHGDELLVSIK
jgi:hypothetical protein